MISSRLSDRGWFELSKRIHITRHGDTFVPPVSHKNVVCMCPECYSTNITIEDEDDLETRYRFFGQKYCYCDHYQCECGCRFTYITKTRYKLHNGTKFVIGVLLVIMALIICCFIWPNWSVVYGVIAIIVFIIGATVTLINCVEDESMDWM